MVNKTGTQFVIATVAMVFLGAATLVAVVAEIAFDRSSDLTLLLVGSLTTAVGQSSAYFFRLNGQSGG